MNEIKINIKIVKEISKLLEQGKIIQVKNEYQKQSIHVKLGVINIALSIKRIIENNERFFIKINEKEENLRKIMTVIEILESVLQN